MDELLKGQIERMQPTTLAGKLRELMPEIDRQVRAGVQHEHIIQTLNANGFNLNLNTFRSYLYRYRRKLRSAGSSNPTPDVETSAQMANGNSPVEEAISGGPSPDFSANDLADALDARKRDELGDKYLSRQRPIFNKRSDKK
ncbi:hypothetical protein BU332_22870 [Salmonella enterica]|nr:hypothetical protein [Salmonella enterica]EBR1292760.1 hypothetical protein [Salmonella enterica]